MVYPKAFIDFLMYFHGNRDYFECHEILEEHWKDADPKNRTSHWVGLIQVAVGFYHYRRGNLTGAERTFKKAAQNIQWNQEELNKLGIHSHHLHDMLVDTIHQIKLDQPYQSIVIPLTDDSLVDQVQARCMDNGYTWCSPSDLSNTGLVHRHSLRDRSEVILERENALRKKSGRPPL
ncbi:MULTISPECIES: DUF309 domain-containing protein [Bacillaceae]|uniref:DUF309 domain-containing protein n=1 Tax=Bacillaceae TaxID=186817 RepID=UPI001C57A424|nr:DUF309 domain-containing protein [Rossellomorea sp. YZS02]MBW3113381.1 DUF309 domain-containing protein [Bacillus sp. MCCB 382]MDX8345487.1 DUF309 domain-containing protein [Rossellomorea sp. YZS02]